MKHIKKLLTIVMMAALVLTMTVPQMTDDAFAATKSSVQKTINGIEDTTIKATSSVNSSSKIKISWTKSKGYKVDYYQVYRSTSKNGTYKKIYTTKSGSTSSYTDKSVTKGKKYYYKVRGVRKINGKNYYTEWSNKTYKTAKAEALTIVYNGETIKFDSSEKAYKDSNGNVMVSIEAFAEYFDADLKIENGGKYAEISKTWTEDTAPYKEDLDGDGYFESYPIHHGMCFWEGSLEGEAGAMTEMRYDEYTGTAQTIFGGGGPVFLVSEPVLKNGKLFVPLEDAARALHMEVTYNSAKTKCTVSPYMPYYLYLIWGTEIDDKTTGCLWLTNGYNVSEAEIVRVNVEDVENGEGTIGANIEKMTSERVKDDLERNGYDPATGLTGVTMPDAYEKGSVYNVEVEVKYTKDNGISGTTYFYFSRG